MHGYADGTLEGIEVIVPNVCFEPSRPCYSILNEPNRGSSMSEDSYRVIVIR